jgi:hypothetical protein
LPDGTHIFKPKIPILEVFAMEDVVYLMAINVYLTAIWYILWPFGIFYGHWYLCIVYRTSTGLQDGKFSCQK